jgi:hypothetical protein
LGVASISDDVVGFVTRVLAYKLLRKCWKDEVLAAVITTVEKSVEGVQMNWDMFLVNKFLTDFTEAQEKGMEFHYAWLLILIALVSWREPNEFQFLKTS